MSSFEFLKINGRIPHGKQLLALVKSLNSMNLGQVSLLIGYELHLFLFADCLVGVPF